MAEPRGERGVNHGWRRGGGYQEIRRKACIQAHFFEINSFLAKHLVEFVLQFHVCAHLASESRHRQRSSGAELPSDLVCYSVFVTI